MLSGLVLTGLTGSFASNYFDKMYECAVGLIKKGKAYVSDLTPDEIRRESIEVHPQRPRRRIHTKEKCWEENLDLF